ELKRLHGELGITFIYVTHDQEEALAMSDRIAVMRQGRIVQLGSGEDIYHRPTSAYVADFIGEANLIGCAREPGGQFRLPGADAPIALEGPDAPAAKLMIRPEDISFGQANAGEHMGTTVTVAQSVFLGHWWRFSGTLPDGQEIVICPRDNTAAVPEVGAQVPVRWSRQAARMLPE
ncbi:ABC transporter ATP-binding protein, partial [Salmonella enterica subsp. enterica]|nr:ABC transporter ATP-binding protein [Salmonella enterica subsp. enterica serovar Enteritidis]